MKATTFPIAVLVFSLVILGMVSIFSSTNPTEYTAISSDPTGQFEVYNQISDVYDDINGTYNQVRGTSGSDSGDSNFLTSLGDIWTTMKNLWNLFSFGIDNSTEISESLGIPPSIRLTLLGIAIISLTVLIISAVVRWRLD